MIILERSIRCSGGRYQPSGNLQQILNLAVENVRSVGIVAEDITFSLVCSIMNIAIELI